MKMAFFENEDWEKPILAKGLKKHKLYFFDDVVNDKEIKKVKDIDVLSAMTFSIINKKIIDKLPKLKLITARSTGFDNIDLDECKKKGIVVCNVPNYGENTVAEHTFALILNLTRKIHKAWEKTRKLDFSREGLRGTDLRGKTLGVIGTGSIGGHVIRIANGFEMKVIAYDVFKNKKLEKKLNFRFVRFDYLLKNSEIISLHCPYNKNTHHLINKGNIKKIKKGSILVNTARGGLVETDALVNALDKGILSAAGLDVLEEECFVSEDTQVMSKQFPKKCNLKTVLENHILAEKENVIVTPHNAFNSIEALHRILETTIENIEGFVKGKVVNKV